MKSELPASALSTFQLTPGNTIGTRRHGGAGREIAGSEPASLPRRRAFHFDQFITIREIAALKLLGQKSVATLVRVAEEQHRAPKRGRKPRFSQRLLRSYPLFERVGGAWGCYASVLAEFQRERGVEVRW